MRVYSLFYLFLAVVCCAQLGEAQTESSVQRMAKGKFANPDEQVSFNADVPYTKAIQSLGELCKKLEGRLLIDRSPLQGKDKTIGINIESMYWKDALELILRSNQLWYNDYSEYIEIISFEDMGKQPAEQVQQKGTPTREGSKIPGESFAPTSVRAPAIVDSAEYYAQVHEVAVSSIFFDVNRTKLAESGMDFSITRGADLNLGINIKNASAVSKNIFTATVAPTGGNLAVGISAGLNMFEVEQLGEVLARPQINVRSGSSSVFQVGADFSVLEKDFSGNTVQKFYPTGTILTIKPRIWKFGDREFIDVTYKIEKSTFESTPTTTIINKTTASGSLTLLNGEEGYVGGMYSNEETYIRQGVPVLKDLPWWVLGLRYIFGYESKKVIKRELLVLLKAEILPSMEERATRQPSKNLTKDIKQEMDKDFNKRKTEK